MSKLYRGVSVLDDKNLKAKLLPKGKETEVAMNYGDEGLRHDGKFTYGASKNNTARSHQIKSGMHKGACVSTTRDISVAKYFATSGNMENGYIYVIDEKELEKYGVLKYEFSDAENPHENEVTLMNADGGAIPLELVIEKLEVKVT